MAQFFQQVVSGLASGGIYGLLALALVLIHRATGVVNFAQGEMAMFSTYIAWTLMTNHGVGYWPAFAITLLASFAGGFGIHQAVIRPVERGSLDPRVVIITIGVVRRCSTGSRPGSGRARAPVQSPFPDGTLEVGDVAVSLPRHWHDCGLRRAPWWCCGRSSSSRRSGSRSAPRPSIPPRPASSASASADARPRWGLAAVLGAIAGMLTAPSVFLDPNMMQSVLIYAFAAAVLGGIDSPVGAVVGGLILGVGLNLMGAYVDFIGSDLRLPAALLVILIVLLVRPAGLFGKPEVKKV